MGCCLFVLFFLLFFGDRLGVRSVLLGFACDNWRVLFAPAVARLQNTPPLLLRQAKLPTAAKASSHRQIVLAFIHGRGRVLMPFSKEGVLKAVKTV